MIDLKFIPFSMYAEGFVSDEDADTLEKYINEDLNLVKYKAIKSGYHNFMTTSPGHSESDDGISWEKYKTIFTPYISSFITSITDNAHKLNLTFYLNLCKKDSFIAPHFDGHSSYPNFMMLYCPKKYENSNPFTTYLTSEKYYQTFSNFEKLPMSDKYFINLYHERGKFFIVPSNLFHWVTSLTDDIDRITLMGMIDPEFKYEPRTNH